MKPNSFSSSKSGTEQYQDNRSSEQSHVMYTNPKALQDIEHAQTTFEANQATSQPCKSKSEEKLSAFNSPYQWPTRRKWTLTLLAVFATLTTLFNGTIITVAHEEIGEAFNINEADFPHTYWLVSSWAVGGGIFSLIILPLFEDLSLRSGFLVVYVAFVLSMIPQSVAPNFAVLLVFRFFSGGFASVLANAAASVISTVWKTDHDRTIPMCFYITAYIAGVSGGPVIGGAIIEYLDWRWMFYIQIIGYSALFPLYFFFFEETKSSIGSADHTGCDSDTSLKELTGSQPSLLQRVSISIQRPLHMLFTEPVLFVFTLWSGLAVGTVYTFTQSTEQVFVELYNWSVSQAGYVQAAVVIGTCIGGSATFVSGKLYLASARRNTENPGTPIPEARLYMSVFASVFGIVGGMLVYGWTAYPQNSWIAPSIGLVMVGFGTVIVVLAAADYVVDAYSTYAGSAVAALVFGENLVAAFLPLATQKMYTSLGFQWASTVLGGASLLLSIAPIALIIFGRRIRARSPLMNGPCESLFLYSGQCEYNVQVISKELCPAR